MLLFVGVPLLEIAVILQVGAAIGGWPTAGILVLDSVIGAWLLRVEGSRAWLEFRRALAEGRWPGDEVAQGALIIVGGTLLVTPGFVTDVVGFAFLVRPTRRLVARAVRSRVRGQVVGGAAGAGPHGGVGGRDARAGGGGARGRGEQVDLDIEVVEVEREQRGIDAGNDEARGGSGGASAPEDGDAGTDRGGPGDRGGPPPR